jgi:hypothetical protein
MSSIFLDVTFQKTDLNTVKELKEDGWRKAKGEEREAFLGFYLEKLGNHKGQKTLIKAIAVLLLVFIGELLFELLCKGDSSYNPVPICICIAAMVLFLLIMLCVYALSLKKTASQVSEYIYVTDAAAYNNGTDCVSVCVNGKKIAFDTYRFTEPVSPTDYVYDENGACMGFRVLLFAVVQGNMCKCKAVLGSSGVRFYSQRFKKVQKMTGGV